MRTSRRSSGIRGQEGREHWLVGGDAERAERGSLVVKNVAPNKHLFLDIEDGLPHQIDCAVIFGFIGSILVYLHDLNIIMQNVIRQKPHRLLSIIFCNIARKQYFMSDGICFRIL